MRQKNSVEKYGSNRPFTQSDIGYFVRNPLYKGFMRWGTGIDQKSKMLRDFEGVEVYRPELQIVSTELWDECYKIYLKRKRATPGSRSQFTFTDILKCAYCGGTMHGGTQRRGKFKRYRCIGNRMSDVCENPQTIFETRVAAVIIPKLVEVLSQAFNLEDALQQAADKYGRTTTDSSLEQEIKAEMAETQAKIKRLTDSVAEGLLNLNEIVQSRDELRDKQARLEKRLEPLHRQDQIRKEYQQAMESLKENDLEQVFTQMLRDEPLVLKKILELVFLTVRVENTGGGRRWRTRIIDYILTPEIDSLLGCNLNKPETRLTALPRAASLA